MVADHKKATESIQAQTTMPDSDLKKLVNADTTDNQTSSGDGALDGKARLFVNPADTFYETRAKQRTHYE